MVAHQGTVTEPPAWIQYVPEAWHVALCRCDQTEPALGDAENASRPVAETKHKLSCIIAPRVGPLEHGPLEIRRAA